MSWELRSVMTAGMVVHRQRFVPAQFMRRNETKAKRAARYADAWKLAREVCFAEAWKAYGKTLGY